MDYQKLSLIIPCYNQTAALYDNLKKIKAYLESNHFQYEIIAVDDGSQDDTLQGLLKAKAELGIIVLSYPENKGKGAAIKAGVKQATGALIGFLDADLAIPIEELPKFLDKLSQQSDIVIASRFLTDSTVRIPVLWYRRMLEKVFWTLRNVILGNQEVQDTQCGFKVFTRDFAKKVFHKSRINRFSFDAELIFLSKKFGFLVEEVPIALQNPPRTSVRILSDSVSMTWDLLKIRWLNWRREYNDQNMSITFDDFGISQKSNDRILDLLDRGIGDRVAVMIEGIISEPEIATLKRFPVSLDLHLDRGKSSRSQRVSLERLFPRLWDFLWQYLFQKQNQRIRDIWEVQVEKFRLLFSFTPQGINTHEHIHFFPPYFRIILSLQSRYQISFLRFGKVRPWFHRVAFILMLLGCLDKGIISDASGSKKKYLVSWDWIEKKKNPLEYCARLSRKGELELIFHPERDQEYAFLVQNGNALKNFSVL